MRATGWGVALVMASAMLGQEAAKAESLAYVGNAGSNEISVFRLAADGRMEAVQTAPFQGVDKAGSSTPLAISPDRRFLFAGIRSQPFQAVTFAIDAKTGLLSPAGNGPLPDSMANIATDHTGRFLFSASYGGNKVAISPIAPDGRVQPALQVVPTGLNAHAFLPDPANKHVFATNLGSDQVLGFDFDAASGRLTAFAQPVLVLPTGSGPRHFVFHPGRKFIYLLDELDAAIHVVSYDETTGNWNAAAKASAMPAGFTGKPWGADIHLTPDARFLYASERTSSTLTAYAVSPDGGALTLIGSVPTEKQPRGFKIDPSGHFLAAVGEMSDGMSVYAIDQTSGALRQLASYPTGKQPNWVEFLSLP